MTRERTARVRTNVWVPAILTGRSFSFRGDRLFLWPGTFGGACEGMSAAGAEDIVAMIDLGVRFVEGVGDRVLEAQLAAVARGDVPRVAATVRAGGFNERMVEPGLDSIKCLGVVCGSGADERGGAFGVAMHRGDGGQAAEAFEYQGSDDHFSAEPEFGAERVRSGLGLTRQQRGQTEVAAVDHLFEAIGERAEDR